MSKISHARHFSKRQSPALNPGCSSGAFYKLPKLGDNIDTSQPINIEWDTSLDCFTSQGVDIYLYAPYTQKSMIHAWGGVSYSAGSFQTTLAGSWWNSSTAPIQLQVGFVMSGTPAFLSPVPPGPLFTSTFNATDFGVKNPTGGGTASASTSSGAQGGGVFETIGNAYRAAGLPKGSIAAAVLVPLIAVAVGIAVYVKFQRTKEEEKRKRWSQAVDKRMSTISTEWKGLPPGAQSEAIRQSIAIMRNSRASVARMSQLYTDGARPSSTFTVESGGAAGVGVGMGARKGPGVGPRNLTVGAAQMANRKSTVSFATDTRFSRPSGELVPDVPKGVVPRPSMEKTRPSGEAQRGRASRAFHTAIGATYLDDEDAMDAMMSPTQKIGPTLVREKDLDLSDDDGVMPALNMIQHTLSPEHVQDQGFDGNFLNLIPSPLNSSNSPIATPPATVLTPTSATPFTIATPYSPSYGNSPTTASPTRSPSSPYSPPSPYSPAPPYAPALPSQNNNPFAGFMRGPSNMMNPDAMLRAYATSGSGAVPGVPMAVAARPLSRSGSAKSTGSGQHAYYPALDAPAQPEPVIPGPPPPANAGGRTLYNPGRARYSGGEKNGGAYGGNGRAA